MADTVKFDLSGLTQLAQDLRGAGASLARSTVPIMKRAGLNIKKDARQRFTGARTGRYLPWYARAISYDVTTSGSTVTTVVGPETAKKQGGMGPGIENGSANHAPIPHLNPAAEAEAPKTEQQLLAAAVKTVLR